MTEHEQAGEIENDLGVQQFLDEEWDQLVADRKWMREWRSATVEEQVYLPLNIIRIIETARTKFRIKDGARSDLHPAEVIPRVKELLERLVVVGMVVPLKLELAEIPRQQSNLYVPQGHGYGS